MNSIDRTFEDASTKNFALYQDIERLLCSETKYKMPKEIDFDSFDFGRDISRLLTKHLNKKIDHRFINILSLNPAATHWLLSHPKYISHKEFSANIHPHAVSYIIKRPHLINWEWFSSNSHPKAVDYMMNHKDKINVKWLCSNQNPRAVLLIEEFVKQNHPDICWKLICKNVSCKHIILSNLSKADMSMVCKNPSMAEFVLKQLHLNQTLPHQYISSNNHPSIIEYLSRNKRMICWRRLSANTNAMRLLLENRIDVYDTWLCSNPAAIELFQNDQYKKWDASLYEYCYWHPYNDQFVDRTQKSVTIMIHQTPISRRDLCKNHYKYIRTLVEHENVESELLKKYNQRHGHALECFMKRHIDSNHIMYHEYNLYKDLKEKRRIISHCPNIFDLEKSNILASVREEPLLQSENDQWSWIFASKCVRILCEYEHTVRRIKKKYNLSYTETTENILNKLKQIKKPIISPDDFYTLYEKRRIIAHSHHWTDLQYV